MTATYDYVIRVSELGDRDPDNLVTINDQRDACRKEIARRQGHVGLELDAVDVSGGVVIDSPAYQGALERVQGGQSRGIVVAYSSRFARNAWAVGRYLEQLKLADGELWFCDRPDIDYRTPMGAIIVAVDSVMNANYLAECKTKAERTIAEKIVKQGIANAVPYGYRRNGNWTEGELVGRIDPNRPPKALVIEPSTAPVVRRIFEERLAGRSWTGIAESLNADRIPAPRGGHWGISTVRSIVGCETYTGVVQYKRRTHRRGKPDGRVDRHENAHEAIVSRATWRAAQASTSVQRTGRWAAGITGGLARCSGCGGRLSVAGTSPHLTYGCRRQRNGNRCAAPVYIIKSVVDGLVLNHVRSALTGRVGVSPETRLAQLLDAEASARAELASYLEATAAVDREAFAAGLAPRQEKLAAATAARESEEAALGLAQQLPTVDAFDCLPLDDQRRVAAALIAEVVVEPAEGGPPADRVEIVWR